MYTFTKERGFFHRKKQQGKGRGGYKDTTKLKAAQRVRWSPLEPCRHEAGTKGFEDALRQVSGPVQTRTALRTGTAPGYRGISTVGPFGTSL